MDAYVAADGGVFEASRSITNGNALRDVGRVYAAYAHGSRGCRWHESSRRGSPTRGRYLVAMLSTAGPPGSFVNVGDGGRPEHTLMPDAAG